MYETGARMDARKANALTGEANMNKIAPANYAQAESSGASDRSSRPSIWERIRLAQASAQFVNRRADAAQRAAVILEKHPEFAELLDALDQF